MSGRLVLDVPFPPSANRLWRYTRFGRVYKTVRVRDFAVAVAVRVRQQPTWQALTPPYRLIVRLYPPDRRRYDVDNCCKALQDALWAALGQDDVTVQEVHLYRGDVDRGNPRAEIVVEALGGAEGAQG